MTPTGELLDARGVAIAPGDTAIYGFGVGRGVAMAEAVVLGRPCGCQQPGCIHPDTCACEGLGGPSLTPSGRVRLRVVRRSYSSGQKPVVDVAPDRLVVLKSYVSTDEIGEAYTDIVLPPSPLPTQAEEYRRRIENLIESYTADLRATEVPDRYYYRNWTLAEFHTFAANELKRLRGELRSLDDQA